MSGADAQVEFSDSGNYILEFGTHFYVVSQYKHYNVIGAYGNIWN